MPESYNLYPELKRSFINGIPEVQRKAYLVA